MVSNIHQNQKTSNCFYLCGLTGGPFFPVPAIIELVRREIPYVHPILIGVKNSYETKIAAETGYQIIYLPKAKLDLLSFKNITIIETLQGVSKFVLSLLKLIFSFAKCSFLLVKYRPIMVYSTGSFLAVPMLWTTKLTNILNITRTKIIIHQQDATIGLANKFTAKLADLKSCVFEYTKVNYKQFQNAELIPNPIIKAKYNANNSWQDKQLKKFVKHNLNFKPILLVFGGGSGALIINNWVTKNLDSLKEQFRIIHLTGVLQKESSKNNLAEQSSSPLERAGTARFPCGILSEGWKAKPNWVFQGYSSESKSSYLTEPSVLLDMPVLLANSDLVICRAGLGSISELSLLNKPTFLVPLPNSHQEQNAHLISQTNSNFKVLRQSDQDNWLEIVNNTKFETFQKTFDQRLLDNYYEKLIELIKG